MLRELTAPTMPHMAGVLEQKRVSGFWAAEDEVFVPDWIGCAITHRAQVREFIYFFGLALMANNFPMIDLDATDRRLLDLLQTDASLSNLELARRAATSPATALRRVRRQRCPSHDAPVHKRFPARKSTKMPQ